MGQNGIYFVLISLEMLAFSVQIEFTEELLNFKVTLHCEAEAYFKVLSSMDLEQKTPFLTVCDKKNAE